MSIREDLIESFVLFGDLSDSMLDKCEVMCNTYNVTPEDLANQWAAYAAGNGASLTLNALENMEQKDFVRQSNSDVSTPSAKKPKTTPTSVRLYKKDLQDLDAEALVINSYSTPTSTKNKKQVHTPFEDPHEAPLNSSPSIKVNESNYSLAVTSSSSSVNYTDSGKCLLSYGPQKLLQKATFKQCDDEKLISINPVESDHSLAAETHYMYEIMTAKGNALDNMTEWLGQCLIKKYQLKDLKAPVRSSGIVTTYGRICCDCNGKLNPASVVLESSRSLGRSIPVPLNFNKISGYSLFPGQVVAVQGYIPSGKILFVQNLYTDASCHESTPIKHQIMGIDSLSILIASGPFTLNNNLTYQPLQDLMKYVTSNPPHVLLLMGPFIEESHPNIIEDTLSESFDSLFETLIDRVMTLLKGLNIQVVLIPSQKDAHHHNVYPTPPYMMRKKYSNLHCFPDPGMINIEGLTVGCTTTDVLLHLGKEELCSSLQNGDRMGRLASYLLSQQSFYPLYPPDDDMCVDHELLEQHAMINMIPHLLIVPSKMKHFVKLINGCVVINPEHLVKGNVGGTFCQVQVFVPSPNELLSNNIVAKIIHI